MDRRRKENLKLLKNFLFSYKKQILKGLGVCIVLVLAIIGVASLFSSEDEEPMLIIENTPIEIETVRPKGEIVVCSSLIEDYATKTATGKTLGLIPTQHTCAQILKMKCSYKIDLDKVEYQKVDTAKVIWVKLPELMYQASLQDSPFISDDEEFWKEELKSTNALKEKVAKQIERRFCTADNRRKGERYAEDAISKIFNSLGYEVEFVRVLERKAE